MKGGTEQKYDNLEPIARKFIEQLEQSNPPPIYELKVEEARNVLNNLQIDNEKILEGLNVVEIHEPISVTIITPKNSDKKLPVLLYIHGGGWVLGNIMTHARLVKEIVIGANVAVIFVNYTPSPEASFHVAIDQAYDTLKFTQTTGFKQQFNNLDTSRIGVMGDSVGGNMAIAVTALSIRNREPLTEEGESRRMREPLTEEGEPRSMRGPKISYLVLAYPVTDASMNTGSYQQFENGPWLTKKSMEWFWNNYEPMIDKRTDDLMSPIRLGDELKKFPSTLIITDENDVLRDEGENFAHKLMNQTGSDVYAIRVLGTLHDFLLLNPVSGSCPVRNTVDIINMNIKKYLGGD